MVDEDHREWWAAVEESVGLGGRLTSNTAELNLALEHVVRLLSDASVLLEAGSPATSAFLAITALEETAKIHIGMFRKPRTEAARNADPLYNHRKKHRLVAAPTIAMGARLGDAIGQERVVELTRMSGHGELVRLREAALYVNRREGTLQCPSEIVNQDLARELLLFAVEAFDDALVGYTNRSFELGEVTDAIFDRWAGNA